MSRAYLGVDPSKFRDAKERDAINEIDRALRDITRGMSTAPAAGAASPNNLTYLTVNPETGLPFSRRLTVTSPLTRNDGGAGAALDIALSTALLGGTPANTYATSGSAGSAATFLRTDDVLVFPNALKTATNRTLTLSDEGTDIKFVSSTGNIAGDVAWLGEHTFTRTNGNVGITLAGSDAGRSPKVRFIPFAGAGFQNVQMFVGGTGAWALENESAFLPLILDANAAAGLKHLSVRDGQVIIGDGTDVTRTLKFDRADADATIAWDGTELTADQNMTLGGDLTFSTSGPTIDWASTGLQLGSTLGSSARDRMALGRALDSRFMFTLQGRLEANGACMNFLVENTSAGDTVTGIVAQTRGRGINGFSAGNLFRSVLNSTEIRAKEHTVASIQGTLHRATLATGSTAPNASTFVTARYGDYFEANPDDVTPGYGGILTTYANYIEDIAFGTNRWAIYSVADDFRCGGKMFHVQQNTAEAHANYADLATDPSPLIVGDLWRNGAALNYRKDGSTTVDLTSGGGGSGDSFLEWAM